MPVATRPDDHACGECRLRFASGRALRRHTAMDHRPAPDGAELTALLVREHHSEAETPAPVREDRSSSPVALVDGPDSPGLDSPGPAPPAPAPPRASPPGAGDRAGGPHVLVLLVVALVALLLGHEPLVALVTAVLAWVLCLARSSSARPRNRSRRPETPE